MNTPEINADKAQINNPAIEMPSIPKDAKVGSGIGWTDLCTCGRQHEIKVGQKPDGSLVSVVDTGWY